MVNFAPQFINCDDKGDGKVDTKIVHVVSK